MARKQKEFTREQFIEALKGLGAVESGRNAFGDIYMLGQRLRLVMDNISVRIQHYVLPEESGYPEAYWSEQVKVGRFDEVRVLPCDDEFYGKCFITSDTRPSGGYNTTVFHLW